jgi:hypothetical protein
MLCSAAVPFGIYMILQVCRILYFPAWNIILTMLRFAASQYTSSGSAPSVRRVEPYLLGANPLL